MKKFIVITLNFKGLTTKIIFYSALWDSNLYMNAHIHTPFSVCLPPLLLFFPITKCLNNELGFRFCESEPNNSVLLYLLGNELAQGN